MALFEAYNSAEISKELRLKIREAKNKILEIRFQNGCFTTQEHEDALNEACLQFGIMLSYDE